MMLQPVTRIVLHCPPGYLVELDFLVKAWVAEGVKYVGVVGLDASKLEDIIDNLCVGMGRISTRCSLPSMGLMRQWKTPYSWLSNSPVSLPAASAL